MSESNSESDLPLPRVPGDVENLRRLRREALRQMDEEERRVCVVVDGGPPPQQERPTAATVYGGPTMGATDLVTRRWTFKRILVLIAAMLAGFAALFYETRKVPVPVYGGPPDPHRPKPQPLPGPKESSPVNGGQNPDDPATRAAYDEWIRKQQTEEPNPSSPATVYGGPPLEPREPEPQVRPNDF